MDDLERELRTALRSVTEPPPAGLLQAVLRRHRRRRRRVGAGCVAAVAAVALVAPAVTQALRPARSDGVPAHGGTALEPPATAPAPTVTAAPGTVLSGCASGNPGGLGARWRTGAVQAGPLWFLNGGHSDSRLRLYVVIAVLTGTRPGSAVVARVAPPGRPYLRFLFGPRDSLSAGTRYSLRSGEAGVTFEACGPGAAPGMPLQRYTDYYGGMLIAGRRCVPVNVWPPGAASPLSVRLGSCPGWGARLPRG